ncbi:hypothetical protein TNCV_163001 [Trichonephila clavipes]|nr:hypothetical protein TNCV_163001 [Trichonephila clavipes]
MGLSPCVTEDLPHRWDDASSICRSSKSSRWNMVGGMEIWCLIRLEQYHFGSFIQKVQPLTPLSRSL